ncbi:Serine/threonine protein kinase [Oceanospirillum multiglobuliferum]|uniref:Protein kinase domain-containing protein n=1 Tax=Oceanospirillum multiglobuliferum TaxID=64969 RepID=A0A1T4MGK5_9GAMM|nr:serine/threonine-protein kinase [Oceanospirillum multiglobuliferum]OPX57032.1 hypothetical protein BTE48_00960 [Oceanospirillum multiglobuliferum]SJZ65995.1 Serine/threonine protein kinase [Oceanospirillum multiglobuliferum]
MNRYIFEKKIATGAGTELNLCSINHKTGVYVVVKQLIDKNDIDNIETELEALTSISSHPNIIKLIDGFIFKDNGFLVYEYYPLGDLFHYIKKNGPFTESQAVSLLAQITNALQHARNHGFFHCDLKPENILIKTPKDFILADWDLARHSHQLKISMHYGSSLAMAPEVILGQLHENSDIYSLGCLMHYCLFGKRAYGLTSTSFPHENIFAHLEKNYEIPSGKCGVNLSTLIRSMMVKNPNHRATLADVMSYLSGRVEPEPLTLCDIYESVPEMIEPAYAQACREKSLSRIQKYQKNSDNRSQSLILAHELILSYLGDKESQHILASKYVTHPLLQGASDRSSIWYSRASQP